MANLHKLGTHKTMVYPSNDFINVKYHNTDVVSFNDNEFILRTGGWFTKTTKDRMNQASNQYGLGYRVFQKNFAWYVDYQNQVIPFTCDKIFTRRK